MTGVPSTAGSVQIPPELTINAYKDRLSAAVHQLITLELAVGLLRQQCADQAALIEQLRAAAAPVSAPVGGE